MNQSRVLLGLGIAVALSSAATAANLAVVATDDNAVQFYRLSNNLGIMIPSKKVPLGNMPVGICADPSGARLYINEVQDKKIAVIDVATQAVATRFDEPGIKRGAWCNVSPDGKKLYLMDAGGNAVFVYDTASGKIQKQIAVGGEPTHGVFSPDGKQFVVSNSEANTLTVIDPATDAVVKTVKTGHEPSFLTYTQDGKFLAVALIDDDCVAFFKADTLEFDQQVGVPQSPQVLIPSPDGKYLYVLGRWHGELGILNMRSRGEKRRVYGTISLPKYPLGMVMSPDGNHLYVTTEHFQDAVIHIDTEMHNPDYMVGGLHHPGDMIYLK